MTQPVHGSQGVTFPASAASVCGVKAVARCVALFGLGLLLAACTKAPVPAVDLQISDGDWTDYHRSLEVIHDRQTREERSEFAKALQELKYQAMITEGLSAGPKLNAAIRQQTAGLLVRDVLVLGHVIRLTRKQAEEEALRRSIAMNHRLRTKPDDEASAAFLASTHDNQARQLEVLRAEITAIESRINELGMPAPGRKPAVLNPRDLDEQPKLERGDSSPPKRI